MTEVGLLVMRYAFPCAEISIRLENLSPRDYAELEEAIRNGKSLPRKHLEKLFPALTRRLKEVAEKENLPLYWTVDAVHAYFLKYHDEYIDKGDGMLGQMSPTEKELCRCRIGKVTEKRDQNVLVLETKDGEYLVLGRYVPEAEVGDIIASHRRFATERLSAEQAAMFGYR
ncbi:hypothetical protein GOV07_04495 [Candidatus Woesearchaeota archaeon]|nr:hypothetical protein [Candidatus Woesearchaeota archaeon]